MTEQKVLENVALPSGTFANMTLKDVETVIAKVLRHPEVDKEIQRLEIPREGVVCEPWP